MDSFKTYKFCQNTWITIPSAIFAIYYLAHYAGNLSWLLSILIAVVGTFLCFAPLVGIFYPYIFGLCMLLGIILTAGNRTASFYLLCLVTILHIVRMRIMLNLNKKYPDVGRDYDAAIRNGYDL